MPRPRKNARGALAPKNGIRSRLYSIVIHDIKKPQAKEFLHRHVNLFTPDWSLIAEEPYNHQDGHHIHLFLKYRHDKAKSTVLYTMKGLNLGGRVQVNHGRSDFNKCKKYLVNPDKEKYLDDNILIDVRKLTLCEKYPADCDKCFTCKKEFYNPVISPIPMISGKWSVHCPKCEYEIFQKRIRMEKISKLFPEPQEN